MEKDELSLEETPEETPPEDENLELQPEGKPKGEDGDPLDKLLDTPEELLAEAKKFRAIADRKAKKPEVKEEKPEKVLTGDFLKKSDFEVANQKKAIRLATEISDADSEETKAVKADMLENWEQVRAFYVSRRGKDTPEDILDDIKDAYTVYQSRKVKKEEKGDASELTKTKVIPGQTPPKTEKPKEKLPPNFSMPVPPSEWYPKRQ